MYVWYGTRLHRTTLHYAMPVLFDTVHTAPPLTSQPAWALRSNHTPSIAVMYARTDSCRWGQTLAKYFHS